MRNWKILVIEVLDITKTRLGIGAIDDGMLVVSGAAMNVQHRRVDDDAAAT